MRFLPAAAALVLLAATPGTALAGTTKLQPGVHIDPGSPAAKQYQIPINSARSETAGKSKSNSSSPPLFGQGVTPSGGSGSGGASGSGSGGHSATHRNHPRATAKGHRAKTSTPTPVSGTPASAPSTSGSSGNSAWLALAAGGVLVLLLGGGGGLVLRRRSYH
jgi:hypothetical protein